MEQWLGGGAIILVIALLWLLYLLPSLQSRHRFHAAERNAVRLNQALRVLAETSEVPEEVRLELSARTANAQQRLARRALAERVDAEKEERLLELENARLERHIARMRPEARQARARRRVRLAATVTVAFGLATAGVGTWMLIARQGAAVLALGIVLVVLGLATLQRMRAVALRAATRRAEEQLAGRTERVEAPVERRPATVEDFRLGWTPRPVPQPLQARAGSRAAQERDRIEAREALLAAAREEGLRNRAAAMNPAPARIETAARRGEESSPYAAMGYVDDAEIEAHVRDMLARRRAG